MFNNKKVLLIAGGGTLGTYTCEELLRLGCSVDIICLEDKISHDSRLKFYKAEATLEYLENLFKNNKYDAIVDFLHYTSVEKYKPYYELLSANTKHLVFLSSYRVYSDRELPITENCPRLLEVIKDKEILENESYALLKSRCEDFLNHNTKSKNYTIVRPVISFSAKRLDLFMYSKQDVIEASENNKPLYLPENAKHLTAGLDWAGNSGKLIANLLFKEETKGETYTISSAPNLTWGEVAEIYSRLLNIEIKWISEDEYLKPYISKNLRWQCRYKYDRCFDRKINNEKVLKATGLNASDFLSIEEGVKTELKKAHKKEKLQ